MTHTDPLTAAAQKLQDETHVMTVRRFLQQAQAEHDHPDTPHERQAEIRGIARTLLERTRSGIAQLEMTHARRHGEVTP